MMWLAVVVVVGSAIVRVLGQDIGRGQDASHGVINALAHGQS